MKACPVLMTRAEQSRLSPRIGREQMGVFCGGLFAQDVPACRRVGAAQGEAGEFKVHLGLGADTSAQRRVDLLEEHVQLGVGNVKVIAQGRPAASAEHGDSSQPRVDSLRRPDAAVFR